MPGYLSEFDPTQPYALDIESISFDDTAEALDPYKGHRISGVVIYQPGVGSRYFPIRHRTERANLLPLDEFLEELRLFCWNSVMVVNHHLKFDMHFLAADDIWFPPTCDLVPTEVLARLIHNELPDYSLEYLTGLYCPQEKKISGPAEWCQEHGTKDYGRVPLDVMTPYALQDGAAAWTLYQTLIKMLPEQTSRVWANERRFYYRLFQSENHGVPLDTEFFLMKKYELLTDMVQLQDKINGAVSAATGGAVQEINPGSSQQLTAFFSSIGVQSPSKTEKGNPSWDDKAFAELKLTMDEEHPAYPALESIVDFKEARVAESTFCTGWIEKADKSHRLHPNFKTAGTQTGRIASAKPNMQNPPKWAMEGIHIPDDWCGIKFDYSQIEYRIFAHYSKDAGLLKSYADNPRTDFHQALSDRLGIDRDPVKTLNFGMLYGMGKKKLRKSLAKEIKKAKDPEKLKRYGTDPEQMADAILEEYHSLVPVRELLRQVEAVIRERGYIKNYFGRLYQFSLERAYVALNYLCQGTAADLFKERLCALLDALDSDFPEHLVKMLTNIHDAGVMIMPCDHAAWYWSHCQEQLTAVSGFRVPILIDGEIYMHNFKGISKDEAKSGIILPQHAKITDNFNFDEFFERYNYARSTAA